MNVWGRDLWTETRERLRALGLCDLPIPEHFAEARGANDVELRSACWGLGTQSFGEGKVAECRIVSITGRSIEILNTMIFPNRPDGLPIFAAELLAFGGKPRLAFVDLQAAGLHEALKQEVRDRTWEMASMFRHLPAEKDVPGWAVEHSLGGYVFTRTTEISHGADFANVYMKYLGEWIELAETCAGVEVGRDETRMALARYKQEHVEHSPGKVYLARIFGEDWTHRFLIEFLYS